MKLGVLLMNTGTADEPTVEAIARYLGEFLMDPAIIGTPCFIRRHIVNGIVKTRPRRDGGKISYVLDGRLFAFPDHLPSARQAASGGTV